MASGWQQGRSTAAAQREGNYIRAAQHLHELGITIHKHLHQAPGVDIRNGRLAMLTCAHGGARSAEFEEKPLLRCGCCYSDTTHASWATSSTDRQWNHGQRGRQHGFMWVREWPLCPKKKCLGLRKTFTCYCLAAGIQIWMINSCD